MKPLISFITPVYNTEKYLEYCVESVLMQTSPNWELILIDDGSTDGSGKICDKYAASDSRIKVIHKENTGQFDSRLRGIHAATGVFCTGLDSDDTIETKSVEILSRVIESGEYDIVAWNVRIVKDDKEVYVYSKSRYGVYDRAEFLKYVSRSTDHSFCNKLIRTEMLLNSVFGNIHNRLRHSEDYILICPSLCKAKRILAIDEILYNYRQLEDSVTHQYSAKRVLDYLDATESIFYIMDEYSMMNECIRQTELKSLVKTVGYNIKQAYKSGNASADDIEAIQKHPIYKALSRYENVKTLSLDLLFFVKLLRLRAFKIISLVYGDTK